jgi:hypothetical protein
LKLFGVNIKKLLVTQYESNKAQNIQIGGLKFKVNLASA